MRAASGRLRMSRRGMAWRAGDWHALARLGGARQGTFHDRSPRAGGSYVAPHAVDGSTSAIRRTGRRMAGVILFRVMSTGSPCTRPCTSSSARPAPASRRTGTRLTSPTCSSRRHPATNVSVEQVNYRPAKLGDVRRLARRLLDRRTVSGYSTRARLNVVERIMSMMYVDGGLRCGHDVGRR